MRRLVGLLAVLLLLSASCGENGESPSGSVSVVRIRSGESTDQGCKFTDDLSRYPATYRTDQENCWQAVTIGPLALDELERMKQEVPHFWDNSLPYQQALVGEAIDGECDFNSPAVHAYLEFSETVSTDRENCVMIVNLGPATREQLDNVQHQGTTRSETAVPARTATAPDR